MGTFPHASQRLTKEMVRTIRQKPKPKPSKRRDTSLPKPRVERQEQAPLTTQLQKQQINDGDENGHQSKRGRLTKKNLAVFNKMGRKKGSHKPSTHDSTDDSTTTKSISTSSSGFAEQAYRNGILEPRHFKPPTNVGGIRERHARSQQLRPPSHRTSATSTKSRWPLTKRPWSLRSAESC